MTGEPAGAPLTRAMQLHRIEPHLHAKTFRMVRHSPLGWKQGKLSMSPARFIERFDLATPRFALAIIDLAQIQNRTLHHTTTCTASAFDDAPVTVFLAVLPSPRDRRRLPLDGNGRRGPECQDDVGFQADQLLRQRWYSIGVIALPPNFHPHVAANDPTRARKRLRECRNEGLPLTIIFVAPHEHADAPHAVALQRLRRRRPRRRNPDY